MKKHILPLLAKITPALFKKFSRKQIELLEDLRFEYKEDKIPGEMLLGEFNWLYLTAKKMNSIVEIGSYKGRSTLHC